MAKAAPKGDAWCWIHDEAEGFLEARVVSTQPDGGASVEVIGRSGVEVKKKGELGAPILSRTELTQDFPDLVRMGDVNEATILRALQLRFSGEKIYTCIGTILVAMNPFKRIDIYGPEFVTLHRDAPPGEPPPPHVYQIAAAAYRGVRGERRNQSIIISGESGAGKTEATKHCLKFFAEAAGSAVGNMQDRLMQANPLMEAFGNAKTVRNNNSSRFGKFMEVHFNGRAEICGCRIQNYLLEKTRIVTQTSTERNYHIFYQLPTAAPDALLAELRLSRNPGDYGYTKHSQLRVEGLDDGEEFKDVLASLATLEFSEAVYKPLFRIVAGLLHLSNVEFEGDADSSRLVGTPACASGLAEAAALLGFDAPGLQAGLTEKLIVARSERLKSPLSPFNARIARDSLAMALYNRMFDWLVVRLNEAMASGLSTSANFVGVLDIAGFEIFQHNSFEQLCINFCNEKLQQHFNNYVFKLELKAYEAEGITTEDIHFEDNQDVLDMVEKKPSGLMVMLDDECRVPKGSDKGFLDKVKATHKANKRFVGQGKGAGAMDFGINHYAGLVLYSADTFLEKNKDELLLNIVELCKGSSMPFVQTLFAGDGGAPTGDRSAEKFTQSATFRIQLDALMATINATDPQYIRCIKSNQAKRPLVYEGGVCLSQLRFAGVFEAVRVRQLGYPFRYPHATFFMRYRCCCLGMPGGGVFLAHLGPGPHDWRAKCTQLTAAIAGYNPTVGEFQPPESKFKLGKTAVLYRATQHLKLEGIKEGVRYHCAVRIQKVWRGVGSRKYARRLRGLREGLREGLRARTLPKVRHALAVGAKCERRFGVEMRALDALEAVLVEEERVRLEEERARQEAARARGEVVPASAAIEEEGGSGGEEGEEEEGNKQGENQGVQSTLSFWESLKQTQGPVILPTGWSTRWDVSIGHTVFFHAGRGEQALDLEGVARICGLSRHHLHLPAGLPPLPMGWKAFVSRSSGLPYYVGPGGGGGADSGNGSGGGSSNPLSPRVGGGQAGVAGGGGQVVVTNPLDVPGWIVPVVISRGEEESGGVGGVITAPLSPTSPPPPPSAYSSHPPKLPPGWVLAVSRRTGISYFRNSATGEAVLNITDIPGARL